MAVCCQKCTGSRCRVQSREASCPKKEKGKVRRSAERYVCFMGGARALNERENAANQEGEEQKKENQNISGLNSPMEKSSVLRYIGAKGKRVRHVASSRQRAQERKKALTTEHRV